ncbi:hypothetical protein sos41_16600 [Alphaproteobacteria bacterium SO-S41]|nr:hypothetical protein sos41_16600 [Alphaproteobacteria bacterium SO-S41]
MPVNRLPQMCGMVVCGIVILGMDAPPALATFFGVIMGAFAHYFMALAAARSR